jgi:nitroreductase
LEFAEVIRRRRMVRTYTAEPVPRTLVDRVVDAARRAPSAGYTQGGAFVVLEGEAQTRPFWELTTTGPPTPGGRWERLRAAPVVILPLAHKAAYLARYGEPDKARAGLDREEAWPVPYWDIDVAFAVMAMLLAATDLGLGALFFGIFRGEEELLGHLRVPAGYRPIGAVSLGWPAPGDPASPSLARGRRSRDDVVHYGGWRGQATGAPQ